jgi:hypothetical protein
MAAERDPALLGSVLAAFRHRYAWNRHDLARWLGISPEQLSALACEPMDSMPLSVKACQSLAERYTANGAHLAAILVQSRSDQRRV